MGTIEFDSGNRLSAVEVQDDLADFAGDRDRLRTGPQLDRVAVVDAANAQLDVAQSTHQCLGESWKQLPEDIGLPTQLSGWRLTRTAPNIFVVNEELDRVDHSVERLEQRGWTVANRLDCAKVSLRCEDIGHDLFGARLRSV